MRSKQSLLALSVLLLTTALPATASAAKATNCKQILAKYPKGIAKSKVGADRVVALGYARPAIQAKVYKDARKLDKFKDGTACVVEANKRTLLAGLSAPASTTSATDAAVAGNPAVSATLSNAVGTAGGMCMVAMRDGKIIGEWYFGGSTPTTRYVPASSSKPAAAAVVGAALQLGRLKLDQSVADFVPEWQGTLKAAITIRHLLTHTSGLKATTADLFPAVYTSAGTSSMIAVNLPLVTAPGSTFDYDSAQVAMQVLVRVIERAVGEKYRTFAEKYVFRPAGMANTGYKGDDPASNGEQGDPVLSTGLHTTCRDLARLGQLFHQKGTWNGQQIFSSEFAVATTSVQVPNAIINNQASPYGYLHSFNFGTIGHMGACGHVLATMPSGVTIVMMSNNPYLPTAAEAFARFVSPYCGSQRTAAVTMATIAVGRLNF